MSTPPMPDAELDVMSCLWRVGPTTARQVREELRGVRPMTHGSVITLLKRLEAKRLVVREKDKIGKAFVYRPTRAPGPTHRSLVRDLLDRVFAGSSSALVAALLDSRTPTKEELKAIRRMVEQAGATSKQGEMP